MSIFTNSYSIVSNESSGLFMMADNGSENGSYNDSNQNYHSDEELDAGHGPDSDNDSDSDNNDNPTKRNKKNELF
jgi:hypothetical protein